MEHFISLSKNFNTSSEVIFNLFRDSKVFQLTGADEINFDFETGKAFSLNFLNRGHIHGKFLSISKNELLLQWNVDGFSKPSETDTFLQITLNDIDGKCNLVLRHDRIRHKEAADAKEKAWTEILNKIEKMFI